LGGYQIALNIIIVWFPPFRCESISNFGIPLAIFSKLFKLSGFIFLNICSKELPFGYKFGVETLILNGFLTFLGLLFVS